jgi:hypothetical protein
MYRQERWQRDTGHSIAVPAHQGLIEKPGDSACQTMDTSLAAFGVEEEKLCTCLQQEMIRNHGFDEDIKHITRTNTMAFQHLIEVYLVHPETSSVVTLCGLCGTSVVFPCATRIDVCQNSEMLTEPLVAP